MQSHRSTGEPLYRLRNDAEVVKKKGSLKLWRSEDDSSAFLFFLWFLFRPLLVFLEWFGRLERCLTASLPFLRLLLPLRVFFTC